MSWLTKWAFSNKSAVTIMALLVLTMGIISYTTLPMEFLPAADNPQVSVIVMGQGTDSKTMESQVTEPIENAVAGTKGKTNIFSTTGDGFSKIDINFESKTDMKVAKQEVQESLSNVQLPANVSKPTVVQLNTSMIPISEISVTFKDGLTPDNLKFAEKKIVPYMKDIKGVSSIQTYGMSTSYVSIKVNNELLAQKHVSLQSVLEVLQGQNSAVSVGEKTIDGKASNIKVIGNIDSLTKIENLSVAENINLKDIASVEVHKPEGTLTRINGADGLVLVVTKDSQSNAVTISKKLKEATKEINKKYDQVETKVIVATADMVEQSVTSMMKEVLVGALFATIVIMLFLRNIRSTFITIVSIPLSLAFTLFLLSRSGVTLNILTLGGVAVAVGRLVDDSIVVIENIFRKMQNEKFSIKLIVEAAKEVSTAITASTLTTVAVFLPIGLVNGGLQDFLMPFALTITYSLLSSLIVALTVVPLMSAGLLKNAKLHQHKPSVKFMRLVTWSLNHKWVVLTLSFVLFVGSISAYVVMPKGAVDRSSADFVQVVLNYPNDTPIEKVKAGTLELEKYLLDLKEVKGEFTTLGNNADAARFGAVDSPTKASYTILLKDKKDTDNVIKKINNQKEKYPNATLTAAASSLMGGGAPQITIDVVGDQLNNLEQASQKIKDKIKNINGIEKIETNEDDKKAVYSIEVDPTKGNPVQVAQQLSVMLNKTPLGAVNLNDQKTVVYLEPVLDPKSADELKNIPVMMPTGMVPVASIAHLNKEEKPSNQFHKDGDPYLRITATVDAKKLSDISTEINNIIFGDKKNQKGLKFADGVKIYVGGASSQQADDFTDLFTTMLVSIGIVFLIMVITFKSIRTPIAILCSLPLAAVGAIVGLLVSRITVDITALLGALMLIGIVVTNAIVLLDRVKQNEKKMIIRDAIVEATAVRMRPILMTAVATISAMIPLLLKKAETGNLVSQSLAIVVIGGLSIATLLTLIVIPVVYELFHFKKSKKQRIQKTNSNELSL
ncbi:efflux RND transporter permease subunit [Neobacillus massiliamazoniensis]|uniref:AcrB/AcrD/AcrF family transporter n=1 Tax=Neobacillus massiliamazoniensis TaxID=1499688 RepID=A0A0U1P025_9BACI|nr:efflux RND transporter permease subunit [Neobacillus massiliamazoniensis]CRK83624.1 AcrB/AcrD/AcrF family transporter [Neobacillus massiliamazoniensis]